MSILHRLGLLFLGAAIPVAVIAAAPANVSGITAVNENGRVRVMWQQVTDQPIAQYRIFYSHASILGNNGLYDDFETVDGSVNAHLLQNVPPADELFVSVLAVNAAGEESPYFIQEASVKLNDGTQSVSSGASQQTAGSAATTVSSAASSATGMQENILRLLGAEAISATGVTLHFSHPVTIAQAQAAQAVMIETASGTRLMLKRLVMQGTDLTIHTEQQTRGIVYRITLGAGISGMLNGTPIPLDPLQGPMLFTGHPTGKTPATGGTSGTPVMMDHPDITQLRLVAQPDGPGTYTVEGTWQAPAGTGLTGYLIAQTTDGGRTYAPPRPIGTQSMMIKIPKVPAGSFGVRVQAQYSDGMLSRGISQVISLPRSGGTQGSITNPGTGSGSLPSSGPALWLAIAGSGAIVGAYRARVRRMQKA